MGLKHWILSNYNFKDTLIFSLFGLEDLFQLGSWSKGWPKLKNSLERASDKCQRTQIIQNLFHGVQMGRWVLKMKSMLTYASN